MHIPEINDKEKKSLARSVSIYAGINIEAADKAVDFVFQYLKMLTEPFSYNVVLPINEKKLNKSIIPPPMKIGSKETILSPPSIRRRNHAKYSRYNRTKKFF